MIAIPVNQNVDIEPLRLLWRLSQDAAQMTDTEDISVIFVFFYGDYWIRQEEFVYEFLKVPLDQKIVIHTVYEGVSMTAMGILDCIDQLVKNQQRDPATVKIYSPNSIKEDCHYENLFFYEYNWCDEFSSMKYIVPSTEIEINDQLKTWALFVGRKTMPRLMALYHVSTDENLKQQTLMSAMIESHPWDTPIWLRDDMPGENINTWLPGLPNETALQRTRRHGHFTHWFRHFPITSIDGISTDDQYDKDGTRAASLVLSLLKFRKQFLFEMVFETMVRGLCFMPTEKTLRAIMAEKPLLVYAAPNFLANLKKLGFKTFDTLWDESYDTLEGPPRYHAMMEIVRSVCAMTREQQLELYAQSRKICFFNRRQLIYLKKHARYNPG